MLEKTGNIRLTDEELIRIKSGDIPERIKLSWNLSLDELQSIILSGAYHVIGERKEDKHEDSH